MMIAYTWFDKDFSRDGVTFEAGKEYRVLEGGFTAFRNPKDVLKGGPRYARVELRVEKEAGGALTGKRMKVLRELTGDEIAEAGRAYAAGIAAAGDDDWSYEWRRENGYEPGNEFHFCYTCLHFEAGRANRRSGDCKLMARDGVKGAGVFAQSFCNRYLNEYGLGLEGNVVVPGLRPSWMKTVTTEKAEPPKVPGRRRNYVLFFTRRHIRKNRRETL